MYTVYKHNRAPALRTNTAYWPNLLFKMEEESKWQRKATEIHNWLHAEVTVKAIADCISLYSIC
jgi:hypothetical protein